ncbi:MAG: DUF805 domain-containing protein [Rickettsiaceae bacterium]
MNSLVIKNLFSFEGRANRKEYIIGNLLTLLLLTLIFFSHIIFIAIGSQYSAIGSLMLAMFSLISCLCLIQILSLNVRRLHDLGFSGWWALIYLTGFGLLIKILLICFKGNDGSNKYGDPPT